MQTAAGHHRILWTGVVLDHKMLHQRSSWQLFVLPWQGVSCEIGTCACLQGQGEVCNMCVVFPWAIQGWVLCLGLDGSLTANTLEAQILDSSMNVCNDKDYGCWQTDSSHFCARCVSTGKVRKWNILSNAASKGQLFNTIFNCTAKCTTFNGLSYSEFVIPRLYFIARKMPTLCFPTL